MTPSLYTSHLIARTIRQAAALATVAIFLLAASISQGATYYYYIHDSVRLPGMTRDRTIQAMQMGLHDFEVTFGHRMLVGTASSAHIHFVGQRLRPEHASEWRGGRSIYVNTAMQWDFNATRQIAWHEPCHAIAGWTSAMHGYMGELYAAHVRARPNPAEEPSAPRPPPQTISDKIIAADIKLWKRTIPYDPSSSDWKKIVKTYRQSGKAAAFARMRNMALKKRK